MPSVVTVIWQDNTFETVAVNSESTTIKARYKEGLETFDYEKFKQKGKKPSLEFTNIASEIGLNIKHNENRFNEFDREALIPNKISTEGPAVAVADINNDGLEDVFMGAFRKEISKLLSNSPTENL